jgi:Trypsin-co-occurring domain 1
MADTISVLVTPNDPGKGIFGTGPAIPVEIPIERLKASLSDLIAKLRAATSDIAAEADGLSLKELEVGIELTAEGGVNLIGTAKVGGTASLKLTFVHD